MLKRVLLPEPDGPMMERYSPGDLQGRRPSSAWTSILPSRKLL